MLPRTIADSKDIFVRAFSRDWKREWKRVAEGTAQEKEGKKPGLYKWTQWAGERRTVALT